LQYFSHLFFIFNRNVQTHCCALFLAAEDVWMADYPHNCFCYGLAGGQHTAHAAPSSGGGGGVGFHAVRSKWTNSFKESCEIIFFFPRIFTKYFHLFTTRPNFIRRFAPILERIREQIFHEIRFLFFKDFYDFSPTNMRHACSPTGMPLRGRHMPASWVGRGQTTKSFVFDGLTMSSF